MFVVQYTICHKVSCFIYYMGVTLMKQFIIPLSTVQILFLDLQSRNQMIFIRFRKMCKNNENYTNNVKIETRFIYSSFFDDFSI